VVVVVVVAVAVAEVAEKAVVEVLPFYSFFSADLSVDLWIICEAIVCVYFPLPSELSFG